MKKKTSQRPAFSPVQPCLMVWTTALVNQVAERSQLLFDYYLSDAGIHTNHYVILFILANRGPFSQSDLAQFLRVDRSIMVKFIDHLEQQQFVERAPNPHDRRSYAVTITPTGRAFLDQATEFIKSVDAELYAPLTEQEREQLHQLLVRLLK